jgi:Zn-dependent M16 (insulinase) family peptidase
MHKSVVIKEVSTLLENYTKLFPKGSKEIVEILKKSIRESEFNDENLVFIIDLIQRRMNSSSKNEGNLLQFKLLKS